MMKSTSVPADAPDVDEYVQRKVARTNGNLYRTLSFRLTRYPIPLWPRKDVRPGTGLLLDIGCGWGRWMIAASRAGYRPVGLDLRLEPAQAARRVMRAHGVRGHVVVADLAALPFRDDVFACVFSYSALQHAHKLKVSACLRDVSRVLKEGASCLVELPMRFGLTNVRHLRRRRAGEDDWNSWAVRYYTWREVRSLFGTSFESFSVSTDCFFGIGVRPEDIDLLPWKYKPIVIASECLKLCIRVFPPLVRLSDSVFVEAIRSTPKGRFTKTPA